MPDTNYTFRAGCYYAGRAAAKQKVDPKWDIVIDAAVRFYQVEMKQADREALTDDERAALFHAAGRRGPNVAQASRLPPTVKPKTGRAATVWDEL